MFKDPSMSHLVPSRSSSALDHPCIHMCLASLSMCLSRPCLSRPCLSLFVYLYVSQIQCVHTHRRRPGGSWCCPPASCCHLAVLLRVAVCTTQDRVLSLVMETEDYEVNLKQLLRVGWYGRQLADTGGKGGLATLDDTSMSPGLPTGCFAMCFGWKENKMFKDPSMSHLVPSRSSSAFCETLNPHWICFDSCL